MSSVPEGLSPLLKLRLEGKLPSDKVVLKVGDEWETPRWSEWVETMPYPEGVIRSRDNLKALDLRVLSGLFVSLHSATYTKRVADIFEALQKYAAHIVLSIESINGEPLLDEWRKP